MSSSSFKTSQIEKKEYEEGFRLVRVIENVCLSKQHQQQQQSEEEEEQNSNVETKIWRMGFDLSGSGLSFGVGDVCSLSLPNDSLLVGWFVQQMSSSFPRFF